MFRLGGAALPWLAFLARLPAALCPVGTLLLINQRDGIGDAGTLAGALWLGQALGGPLIGRLADRHGHRPVLLVSCTANAAVLAGLVAAVLGGLPPAARIALACAAGLTVPQIGPLARTRWVRLAGPDRALVGTALSFDTTLDEASFMVGPALAGLLAVTVHPAAALVLAAALILVFGTLFALHPTAPRGTTAAPGPGTGTGTGTEVGTETGPVGHTATAPAPAPAAAEPEAAPALAPAPAPAPATTTITTPTPTPTPTPTTATTAEDRTGGETDARLRSPGLTVLTTMAVLQGAAWSSANTGVNALAREVGSPGAAGLVWAAMAVTSSAAGFATVARPGRVGLVTRLRRTVAAQALLTLPLLAVGGSAGAALGGAALAVAGIGLAVAPHLIALFGLAERVAPARRMAEAMTLLGSALIIGQALAAAAAGRLAAAYGPRAAFVLACAAMAVSALVALRGGGLLRDPGTVQLSAAPTSAGRTPSSGPPGSSRA
ncbi:MFS transporter [Streptomyces sp. NRRL S-87]|uniref:MFS transporter n=1 Tax=Streptomyces sp. NRRL S-87 TaxID=1463920 RepID=UPI000561BE6C|nr:MFS transporter [Streptomyces sp. NRRL S-87]